jgi:hypothetical protein
MSQKAHGLGSRGAAAAAFGPWLNRLQYEDRDPTSDLVKPWHYWGTLTFREERSRSSIRRHIQGHLARCGVSRAFWGVEAGKVSGRLHGHALYHFDRQIPPQAKSIWEDWWTVEGARGRAHVDQFEQEKGATHYVSKYVTKDLADYDVQGKDLGGFGL